MSLIVDASVVIKWFVEEPLHAEARHIYKYQRDILAPDFVLVEVANVAWKKVQRQEIGTEQAYEIVNLAFEALPGFIHSSDVLTQAAKFAIELAHPVYDCLYLACLDGPQDILVTGDRRFFNKAKESRFGNSVRFLDDSDLALPLYISFEKLKAIIGTAEQFWRTTGYVADKILGSPATGVLEPEENRLILDSPTYRNLELQLVQLDNAEVADVYALGLLGEGESGVEWGTIREKVEIAFSRRNDASLIPIINLTRHLEAGLAALRDPL